MKINSVANIGDRVIFQQKKGKYRLASWQHGWEVVGVTKNVHDIVHRIIISKGKVKRTLEIFKEATYVVPPHHQIAHYDDVIANYSNLVVVRHRGTEPPKYRLLCVDCHAVVSVTQQYTESFELVLSNGSIDGSKPYIEDSSEKVGCECDGRHYEIEYEPY
jgi:hypothetical protein